MKNSKITFYVLITVVVFSQSHTILHAAISGDDVANKSISRLVSHLNDSDLNVSKDSTKVLEPVVRKEGDHFQVDPQFVQQIQTYAEMADLSYHLVSGRVELSEKYLEKFIKEGWKISGFSGLSGNKDFDQKKYDAKNLDLAGFLAFNPKTNEAVITFHGSQDSLDWENNFMMDKVDARKMGFKFDGKVHRGFAERYKSSKDEIYSLLKRTYLSLNQSAKDEFHITTTGHSLGGGMATIGYADLATDWAKQIWGDNYKNTESNRIRGFAMSPPRAFDEAAISTLTHSVGVQNLIIDTNDFDPVSKVGPGRVLTALLMASTPNAPLSWLLKGANKLGLVDESNPQLLAQKYGGYRHLGTKATQSTAQSMKEAVELFSNPGGPKKTTLQQTVENIGMPKTGIIDKAFEKIKSGIAAIHYGSNQTHGLYFDPRLIHGSTIEARINKASPPSPVPEKKSFWQKVKNKIFG
ncbi:Lipase class 3 family protein [Candidatus Bealeia paramacronuclearis]|uniref:Lipase class 3 family protein n=1 Tax=Candidatus Bealeia paramacronuclearis TaxID=1921001 RepID=A0ABZ2C4P3_9PROT|nr:Lipase class 3 family protein [Candidatus Bealeia paramacronuclearis]